MNIYTSILLSSLLISNAIALYTVGDRRTSLSTSESQTQILAEGENPDTMCDRGSNARRECSVQFIEPINPVS